MLAHMPALFPLHSCHRVSDSLTVKLFGGLDNHKKVNSCIMLEDPKLLIDIGMGSNLPNGIDFGTTAASISRDLPLRAYLLKSHCFRSVPYECQRRDTGAIIVSDALVWLLLILLIVF